MRRLLLLVVLFLANLTAVDALPQAPPVRMTYAEAYAEAMETGEPLVAFIGQPSRPVYGCIVCEMPRTKGFPAVCVITSVRNGNYLEVVSVIAPPSTQPQPQPVSQSFSAPVCRT